MKEGGSTYFAELIDQLVLLKGVYSEKISHDLIANIVVTKTGNQGDGKEADEECEQLVKAAKDQAMDDSGKSTEVSRRRNVGNIDLFQAARDAFEENMGIDPSGHSSRELDKGDIETLVHSLRDFVTWDPSRGRSTPLNWQEPDAPRVLSDTLLFQ
jgi:hypothetical protein